jgi:uncharacterized glyoxalase superfamily protein PhnB
MTDHNIWPGFTYDDAIAARSWLGQLGFADGILVTDDHDPSVVVHSEMYWPEGGRVMVSSRAHDSKFATSPGAQGVYVVCDDPDAVFARAQVLNAAVVQGMQEEDYGSRGFSIRDVEGNIWSFGTYAGS